MRAAELHAKIAELAREGVPFVVATIVDVKGSSPRGVGARMLVLHDGSIVETIGGGVLEKQVITDALTCIASGVTRSERYELREEGAHALGSLCGGEATVFFEVHAPARTLLIVGAGHVGQKLCSLARLLDYQVVVLDSRQDMVTAERFPDADRLICGDPSQTAELFDIGERTHVVIVTHGHLHDKGALRSALGSAAASVGMIGSAKKVRTIFAQLREEGVPAESLERVHSPIGLDIGAETPAELALSIMAEIVADSCGKLEGRAALSVGERPVSEGGRKR
jgi:xanthine dehydrogenase accessory factor